MNRPDPMDGVRPCPVCHSMPTLDKLHTRGGWGYVFRCTTCPPPVLGSKICYSHQEAKMEWNKKYNDYIDEVKRNRHE